MKTHTQVIVIGGGVVGCSVLYHLTRLGWPDVVLLERKELTAGSTWHAAAIYRHTRVEALKPQRDGGWEVITDKGSIRAEHVVNAAGLWAREVGEMAGVQLPLHPFEHHYLVTGALPGLRDHGEEIPTIVDLDWEMYLRQEQEGVLLGVYETPATPWALNGTPWDFGGSDLLPDDLDRLHGALEKGFARFPEVADAGIKRVVNGPFTFSPDGNPLVGKDRDAPPSYVPAMRGPTDSTGN